MVISRKYEVQGQLGRGSMGVVYKVRHTTLDTLSALKVLPPQLAEIPELVKRFHREARVMARLNHPNIVRVIDIDRDEALHFHYFVMEYICGQTLREYLQKKGPLPLVEVLKITRQIARALDYAHSYTPMVIHRDIKPSNIMIEDSSGRVVVMDFGIAKELDESDLTKAETMLGTVKYCPPEQMRHEPLDSSADVYALGMVMYEAYTGIQFFAGLGEHEVMGRVLDPACENQPHFTRPAPPAFVALVTKAVAKSRDQRYRRMADLLSDLEASWPGQSEQASILNAATLRVEPQPAGAPDEIKALEEQIYKLEEERQRRLLSQLQAKVREARERAAQEGAGQWASALFQQGLAEEEGGLERFRNRQYVPAQQAYQAAAGLYAQAYEQAAATALAQRAEQARQTLTAVKVEADHYGAVERAHTSYGRGLALQAQAEELWGSKAYEQAFRLYDEALSVFEEARDISYRTLLTEEAGTAREQMNAARESALRERSKEFAPQILEQARLNEQRAERAVNAEEFTQARDWYRAACQHYESAARQAHGERRRRALSAQQQTQQARDDAEAGGASSERGWYRRATEAQAQGDARLHEEAYEQAAQAYEQARAGYERAQQEAEHARRRQAVIAARQRMEEAWVMAEQIGVRQRLGAEFAKAQRLMEQGRECEQGEQFAEAVKLYEEATQVLMRLCQAAELQAMQEEAEAARQRLIKAKQQGILLRGWAEAAWTKADLAAAEAEMAWQQQAYGSAVSLYAYALQACERAQAEAGQARCLAAQEEMNQGRAAAEAAQAQQYAQQRYQRALEVQRQGAQKRTANRWEEAAQAFIEAGALFGESLREAQRTRVKQAAEAGKEAALAAQQQAHAGAELFPERFAEALALLSEGEQRLKHEDFDTARTAFERSSTLFQQIGQEAVVYLQRQQAAQTRAEAEEWTRKTASAKGRPWRRAHTILQQGDRLFQQGNYPKAQAYYQQATSLFSALQKAASAPSPRRKRATLTVGISGLTLIAVLGGLYLVLHKTPRETPPTTMPPPAIAPPPDTVPPGVDTRPVIVWGLPDLEGVIPLAEGHAQTFIIQAESPQGSPLQYAWFLDGEKQADGEQWTYQPDFTEASATPKEVKVVVTGEDGRTVERTWQVRVTDIDRPPTINRSPRIEDALPQTDTLELSVGEQRKFSVQAADPDSDDRLAYGWFLDSSKVGEGERWQFQAASPEALHSVTVAVMGKGGLLRGSECNRGTGCGKTARPGLCGGAG